jgi:hypothetical protein
MPHPFLLFVIRIATVRIVMAFPLLQTFPGSFLDKFLELGVLLGKCKGIPILLLGVNKHSIAFLLHPILLKLETATHVSLHN